MKVIALVMGSLLALAGALFALTRLGAAALLLLAALGGVAWLLARKLRTDPYVGWGYLRAAAVMAALASGAWAVIAFLSGGFLLAIPLGAALALCLWSIAYCTQRINGTAGPTGARPVASAQPSLGAQNLEAANALTDQIIDNHRRSNARGRSLHLQGENLDLMRRNRELEGEVTRLRQQVNEREDALRDPFYDPMPKT